MEVFLEECLSSALASLVIMEAVKPWVLLDAMPTVTLLRRKVPALPLAQLTGVVMLIERTSLTLTLNSVSCSTAEVFDGQDVERKIATKISASTNNDFAIFLCIFPL